MKIKNIIERAAILLNLSDLLRDNVFADDTTEESLYEAMEKHPQLKTLIQCVNISLAETASLYFPLYKTQSVRSDNGKIFYSELDEAIIAPVSVYSAKGREDFEIFPDHIETVNGSVAVTYNYLPAEKGFFDDAEISPSVTLNAIAYKTASDYCYVCGMNDYAVMWDKRFKDSLSISAVKRRYKPMPIV